MITLKQPASRRRQRAVTTKQLIKAADDRLEQYLSSLGALRAEKAELEARLARIEQALSGTLGSSRTGTIGRGRRGPRSRGRNSLSLRDAVAQVTRQRPLTKPKILQAIQKIGYRFSTNDPMNSLNAMLYAPANKFRRQNGRFSPK